LRPLPVWQIIAGMDRSREILLIAGSAEAHDIAGQIAQTSQKMKAILRRPERSFGPLAVPSEVWMPATCDEMKNFLKAHRIAAVCDAGHGFDADTSQIAADAAASLGLTYLRVLRPAWDVTPPAESAPSVAAAADMIRPGARVFAATGRGTLDAFSSFKGDRLFLRQASRAGGDPVPDFVKLVQGTPPFEVNDETALFQLLNIDTLICRNVGGRNSRPKLDAALRLGLRAIVIDRPDPPEGARVVTSARAALDWIAAL